MTRFYVVILEMNRYINKDLCIKSHHFFFYQLKIKTCFTTGLNNRGQKQCSVKWDGGNKQSEPILAYRTKSLVITSFHYQLCFYSSSLSPVLAAWHLFIDKWTGSCCKRSALKFDKLEWMLLITAVQWECSLVLQRWKEPLLQGCCTKSCGCNWRRGWIFWTPTPTTHTSSINIPHTKPVMICEVLCCSSSYSSYCSTPQ